MLEISALGLFAFALLMAAGSPGPSVAALVSRVLVRGWREAVPFVVAMWIGEAIWLGFAIGGLAALAETFHWAFLAIKYCGVAYLAWLAWRMWRAPEPSEGEAEGVAGAPRAAGSLRLFLAGLSVTLGNPKIMVFYLALLPALIDLRSIGFAGWLALTATLLLVLAFVDIGYMVLASRARLLLRSPRAMLIARRTSAAAMGGAAAMIASR